MAKEIYLSGTSEYVLKRKGSKMYALVDCNNFYVSCERVFRPDLMNRPVIVLSNNDGCVVSRSKEAKALGIGMAVPAYQVKKEIEKYKIKVFSSNYTLYGDFSSRVMAILQGLVPEMEIYSIDEAFLNFTGMDSLYNLKEYGEYITRTVSKGTGIPVSMGIAPTKTLAKIANLFAKRYSNYKNVCYIDGDEKRIKALRLTGIEEVWGIGRRHTKKLRREGINTAYDFTLMPQSRVRNLMTVTGERTWLELQGEPCIDLEAIEPSRKQICTSRSFGKSVSTWKEISEGVSTYAVLCAEKLRKQKSCAVSLLVFIHTNNFRKDLPQYFKSCLIRLPVPTDSTIEIVKHTLTALKKVFKEGYLYKKAGVIITEMVPKDSRQANLFYELDHQTHSRVMEVLDTVNQGFLKNKIMLGVQGTERDWFLRQKELSPCYSTDISKIIKVKTR